MKMIVPIRLYEDATTQKHLEFEIEAEFAGYMSARDALQKGISLPNTYELSFMRAHAIREGLSELDSICYEDQDSPRDKYHRLLSGEGAGIPINSPNIFNPTCGPIIAKIRLGNDGLNIVSDNYDTFCNLPNNLEGRIVSWAIARNVSKPYLNQGNNFLCIPNTDNSLDYEECNLGFIERGTYSDGKFEPITLNVSPGGAGDSSEFFFRWQDVADEVYTVFNVNR